MQAATIVTLILTIYLILAMLGGFRQGLLGKGRWVLGVVFSILAAPLISPLVNDILMKTKVAQLILTDIPAVQVITSKILWLLVFSISIILIKKLVYFVTDIDLPGGLRFVDRCTGAIFTVMEALLVIWVFELLMKISSNASMFVKIHQVLMQSHLYAFIAGHNIFSLLFR